MKTSARIQTEFCNASELLVGFENELTLGSDGWAQIAPFGDFPGMSVRETEQGRMVKEPAIQRMDREAVAQMVNEYQANTKGVRGFARKRPIYIGHPDGRGVGHKYPHKHPVGVFANIALRADGLYGEPIFTEEGEQLIASGQLRAFSGRWEAELVHEEGGKKVYRPCKFLSAGLTNQPNLPVQLLNEAEMPGDDSTHQNTIMKKTLIALLTKLGVQFANDATDDQLVALEGQALTAIDGLAAHGTKVTELANEKETLTTSLTSKDGEIAGLRSERDTLKTNFVNERNARIESETAAALQSGRITAAELPDWKRRLSLEAQFANELTALKKLEPKVKTASVTINRGDRKVELANAKERGAMLTEIINEIATEKKLNPVTHYNQIVKIAQTRHPALFEAMAQPTIR